MITKVTDYCIEAFPFGTLPMAGVVTLFKKDGNINVNCQPCRGADYKETLEQIRKIEEAVITVQALYNQKEV